MSEGQNAHDPARLLPEQLARDGEILALATLARRQVATDGEAQSTEALVELAGAADKSDAFAWLWSLLEIGPARENDGKAARWGAAGAALADDLQIPRKLQNAVAEFIVETQPAEQGQRDPGGQSELHSLAAALLRHLPPEDWVMDLAARLVEDLNFLDARWESAAAQLARSETSKRLNALVKTLTDDIPADHRVSALIRIPIDRRRPDDESLLAAILGSNLLDNASLAGEALRSLPDELALQVCSSEVLAQAGDDYLNGLDLARADRKIVKTIFLSDDVADAVKRGVIDSASKLSLEDYEDLATWLYRKDPEEGSRLVTQAISKSSTSRKDPDAQAAWTGIAGRIAVAACELKAALEVGRALSPEEMTDLITGEVGDWTQMGSILTGLTRDIDLLNEHMPALLHKVPEGVREQVAEGLLLVDDLPLEETLVELVADWAFEHPETQPTFFEYDLEEALVSRAETSGSEEALSVMKASSPTLSDTSLDRLSQVVSWRHFVPRRWKLYSQYLRLLADHPDLVVREARDALESLVKPSSEQITTELLAEALREGVDAGLGNEVGSLDDAVLAALFGIPGKKALKQACLLLGESEPTEREVDLLVKASADLTDLASEIHMARRKQAERIGERARDDSKTDDERAKELGLCAKADPEVASQVALILAGANSVNLRKEAATVLAGRVPTDAEVAQLERLIKAESHGEVRQILESAVRRHSSGDAGEALRNLYELVGLDPAQAPSPDDINLPQVMEARFQGAVDSARVDRAGSSKAYCTSVASLNELLVEIAIVVTSAVGQEETQRILSNSPKKPDVGTLINRQNLTEKFTWFHSAGSIHNEFRGAHAARSGSTSPKLYDDGDKDTVTALLRLVVDGWVASLLP